MKDADEKIFEAYRSSVLESGDRKKQEKLDEASPVEFSEIPEDRQKLVMALVGKNDVDNHDYFDGIHGIIVQLQGKFGTNSFRVKKQDLKKIMSDKNVRWVDISAIGF